MMVNAAKKSAEPAVHDPAKLPGRLKLIGGSMSDDWNNIIANQVVSALWLQNSDAEQVKEQRYAAVDALVGIAPRDELEGMIAAQLVACHNASMECYRRAMIGEQTFEGRRENLSQANKLSRTYAALLDALNRPPRQGPTEGHRGARACAFWRAGGGRHGRDPGGWGSTEIRGSTPCKANCLCTSAGDVERGRGRGSRCQSPAMPNGRCRMHGGTSPGAPKGNKNAVKHGRYTADAIARRRAVAVLIRAARQLMG